MEEVIVSKLIDKDSDVYFRDALYSAFREMNVLIYRQLMICGLKLKIIKRLTFDCINIVSFIVERIE